MKLSKFFKLTMVKIVIVIIIALTTIIAGKLWPRMYCDPFDCKPRPLEFLYPYLYEIPTLPAYIIFEGHLNLIEGVGWIFNILVWYVFACIITWLVSLLKNDKTSTN